MKIGLVQSEIIFEKKEENIRIFEGVLENYSDKVDVLLLPEMSFTGFSMNVSFTGEDGEETLNRIRNLSKKYRTIIGFGWVSKKKNVYNNHYTVVDNDGNVIADYEKIHPFMQEKAVMTSGDRIVSFNLGNIPFSVFICFDLRFPEIFRCVTPDAHVIIIPANWPAVRMEHWKSLLKARAIENQVYVMGINCFGSADGIEYSGDSCIINPNGDIEEILSNKSGIILYDLDDNVDIYRDKFPVAMECNVEGLKGITLEKY